MSGYQRIVAYDRSLFLSNPSLSNIIPRYSLTILSLSLSLFFSLHLTVFCSFSFSLAPAASVALPRRTPFLLHSHLCPHPGTSYISLPPSCPLFPVALSPNLHTIPLLSSLHSTPKYCNFSLVATTALQLRNDKFLARLSCLVVPPCRSLPFLRSSAPHRPRSAGNHFVFPARLSSSAQLTRLTRLLPRNYVSSPLLRFAAKIPL